MPIAQKVHRVAMAKGAVRKIFTSEDKPVKFKNVNSQLMLQKSSHLPTLETFTGTMQKGPSGRRRSVLAKLFYDNAENIPVRVSQRHQHYRKEPPYI